MLTLLLVGALWDLDWRHKQQRGQTQLYLLLSTFSPLPSPDCDRSRSAYCFLLASALDAGLSPTREDKKGRSALFVLCERMACTTLGDYRDFYISSYGTQILCPPLTLIILWEWDVWLAGRNPPPHQLFFIFLLSGPLSVSFPLPLSLSLSLSLSALFISVFLYI